LLKIALISPEDLYKACLEFERLELPMKLHRFSSGLLVVKSDRYSEQAIVDRIMAYLDSRQFITSLELAESENISSSLALEQLLAVERIAKVCRDEAVEGLRFYSNDILLHNEKAHAHVDE
jgi:ESCRT-II complex subunit VPS36